MDIQWYPGHMTKAKRMMQENIKLIDVIIELVDARIPISSKNPDIDNIAGNKSRIILLNKVDLADDIITEAWKKWYEEKGFFVHMVNSKTGYGVKNVTAIVKEACKEKIERDRKRGIKNRPVRAMIVGIPNVGKSTFINSFAGKACAKTGNKPGVTKGKQWIKLSKEVELLDTPGILWPKFDDQKVGINLALIGSINDDILNMDELALKLIAYMREYYADNLNKRYDIICEGTEAEILNNIAKARGCVTKGNELDYSKAARILIDEFKNGHLGRVSLEVPNE